jgi:hypothetical protein
MAITLLLAALLDARAAPAQPVYETRDRAGPVFSDLPSGGAREVELPPQINLMDSVEEPAPAPEPVPAVAPYRAVQITQPENGGTVHSNTGQFSMVVAIGHRARCAWCVNCWEPLPPLAGSHPGMMLVETAMSVASPWPLKIILDNVVGDHKPPAWLDALRFLDLGGDKMELAAVAGAAVVVIALLGAIASYIDNYYTESVSQWVAHDLRMRVYDHLHRLSLGYYDTHQTGPILSTLTADVKTIQGFASSGTLGIVVDLLTIVGMVGIMFWLDWDFALIAIGATPFLLLFVARFNKEVKAATHEVRRYQSDIVAVVQQGLESMRIVKAFGRQELEKTNSPRSATRPWMRRWRRDG